MSGREQGLDPIDETLRDALAAVDPPHDESAFLAKLRQRIAIESSLVPRERASGGTFLVWRWMAGLGTAGAVALALLVAWPSANQVSPAMSSVPTTLEITGQMAAANTGKAMQIEISDSGRSVLIVVAVDAPAREPINVASAVMNAQGALTVLQPSRSGGSGWVQVERRSAGS